MISECLQEKELHMPRLSLDNDTSRLVADPRQIGLLSLAGRPKPSDHKPLVNDD